MSFYRDVGANAIRSTIAVDQSRASVSERDTGSSEAGVVLKQRSIIPRSLSLLPPPPVPILSLPACSILASSAASHRVRKEADHPGEHSSVEAPTAAEGKP